MVFKIYAALYEDINVGWVWIGNYSGNQRSVVKIVNKNTKKFVYCEALKIDKGFKARYMQGNTVKITDPGNSLIMNEWYRKKLGIYKTKIEEDISVSEENHLIGYIMASIQHPQIIVRLATQLGILSVLLGLISLVK